LAKAALILESQLSKHWGAPLEGLVSDIERFESEEDPEHFGGSAISASMVIVRELEGNC